MPTACVTLSRSLSVCARLSTSVPKYDAGILLKLYSKIGTIVESEDGSYKGVLALLCVKSRVLILHMLHVFLHGMCAHYVCQVRVKSVCKGQ
jgi:hypothetical protein